MTTLAIKAYCPNARRSSISCWRNGILSMEREISRMLHGDGLRKATLPSLATSAIMYPRGRSSSRRSDRASGSVSVKTITSRSASSSKPPSSRSICWRNRGSLGVSAKTTRGRAIHCRSANVTSAASKTCAWSSSQRSNTVASWANRPVAPKKTAAAATCIFNNFIIHSDIEAGSGKAKGQVPLVTNNFSTPDRRFP